MSEGQPMATAPKDGRVLRLLIPDYGWVDGFWDKPAADRRIDVYTLGEQSTDDPTHWQPLPT